MISLNLDDIELPIDVNYIMTFVEFLEREEIAREKQNITNGLSKPELLLIYVCYFIDKVFPRNEDTIDNQEACPTDVALINCVFIKLASIDLTYTDRVEWIKQVVKIVYEIYNQFLTCEDMDKLFSESFSMVDNLLYDLIINTVDNNIQQWDYLALYDKNMISMTYIRYMNTYLETINNIYDDGKPLNEDIDIDYSVIDTMI